MAVATPFHRLSCIQKRLAGCGKLITYKEWRTEWNIVNATSKKTDKVTVSKKTYQSVQDVKTVPIIKFIDQVIKDIKELKAHAEQKISQPNQVH